MKEINPYQALEKNIVKMGNRPIFFIGSGISRRYLGLPNWEGLLKEIILSSNLELPIEYYLQKNDYNYEKVGTDLSNILFENAWSKGKVFDHVYYTKKYMKDIFIKLQISSIINGLESEKPVNETDNLINEYKLFGKTNPHAIITTNYDRLIENTFANTDVVIGQKIILDKLKGNKRKVLKIHGCISQPESILINEEDYENFIKTKKYLSAKLLTYFMEFPVFILGYSLSDRNILGVLQTISEINVFENRLSNIWFVNYSTTNLEPVDILEEKVISLPNNKNITVNQFNVRSYQKLFRSIMQANEYPYSLTAIAQELGYKHWKQIEKYKKNLNISSEDKEYSKVYGTEIRYSEKFFLKMKREVERFKKDDV